MKLAIILIVATLAGCGGGTDPCDRADWKDVPSCVPPVPLPCIYPCPDQAEHSG